jgi:hypothetical protein
MLFWGIYFKLFLEWKYSRISRLKLLEAVEVQLQARPFIGLTEAPAYSYFLMNFLNITF